MKLWTLLLALLLPTAAHAANTKDAQGIGDASISAGQMLTVHSDRYEVVLKEQAAAPGLKDSLDLYLSDFRTNAPIANATIALSLRSDSRELWTGSARATPRAGIFVVPFAVPADTGSFTLLLTIRAATGEEERFALSGFEVSREHADAAHPSRGGFPWMWLIGIAVVLFAGMLLLARRRATAVTAAIILCLVLPPSARAHEGHDDAPTASGAPVGPGAQVYVAGSRGSLWGSAPSRLHASWSRGV
ncbi:MAG: hypothetical protein IPL06_19890 [Betaproteobacteria bacterium]|nr:hypothetical protein [Betaproteobacteria bacterium]